MSSGESTFRVNHWSDEEAEVTHALPGKKDSGAHWAAAWESTEVAENAWNLYGCLSANVCQLMLVCVV